VVAQTKKTKKKKKKPETKIRGERADSQDSRKNAEARKKQADSGRGMTIRQTEKSHLLQSYKTSKKSGLRAISGKV